MAHRKATLRKLTPLQREYARLLNDLDGLRRRFKNFESKIGELEHDSRALKNHSCTIKVGRPINVGDEVPGDAGYPVPLE